MFNKIKTWFTQDVDGKRVLNSQITLVETEFDYQVMQNVAHEVAVLVARDFKEKLLKDNEELEKLMQQIRIKLVEQIFEKPNERGRVNRYPL